MVVALTFILFVSGLVIAAAFTDFFKLKIPNIIPLLVIASFAIAYGVHHFSETDLPFQTLPTHLMTFIIVGIVMVILFFAKMFGGGDAKLIPAVALWVGLEGLPLFLMITSIVGGVLALTSIILRKTKLGQKLIAKLIHYPIMQSGWVGGMAQGRNVVPYGIAIAAGAIAAFRQIGYLP